MARHNMNKKLLSISLFFITTPVIVAAAVTLPGIPNQVSDFNTIINGILNLIWPLFIGFAVIMFIVAGFFYLKAQGEPNEVKEANKFIIWGAVGVLVAVLAFTIPYFIQNTITNTNGSDNGGDLGACTSNGSCSQMTEGDCSNADGVWEQGACPVARGSCCTMGGVCSEGTEDACSGTWTSGGSCEPNICGGRASGSACTGNEQCESQSCVADVCF